MKQLALSIGDTPMPVNLPGQVNKLNNLSGKYGLNILRLVTDLLILAAVIISLFLLIYGGIKWLMSEGDKKKIEDARNTIIFSIIGLVIVFFAFFIINILGAFFNVPILSIQ